MPSAPRTSLAADLRFWITREYFCIFVRKTNDKTDDAEKIRQNIEKYIKENIDSYYVDKINKIVYDKFLMSKLIIENNYYKKVLKNVS